MQKGDGTFQDVTKSSVGLRASWEPATDTMEGEAGRFWMPRVHAKGLGSSPKEQKHLVTLVREWRNASCLWKEHSWIYKKASLVYLPLEWCSWSLSVIGQRTFPPSETCFLSSHHLRQNVREEWNPHRESLLYFILHIWYTNKRNCYHWSKLFQLDLELQWRYFFKIPFFL